MKMYFAPRQDDEFGGKVMPSREEKCPLNCYQCANLDYSYDDFQSSSYWSDDSDDFKRSVEVSQIVIVICLNSS